MLLIIVIRKKGNQYWQVGRLKNLNLELANKIGASLPYTSVLKLEHQYPGAQDNYWV